MSIYVNNFIDEGDLVECLSRGCEVDFLYKGKKYSITHTDAGVSVIEFYNEESEMTYADIRESPEYQIGDKKLKDIISEMKVIDRSF